MRPPQEVLSDFRNHAFFCMKHLGLGEPTPMQYEIARQLQSGPNDFILAAGRGTGKSTLTAMFASWFMLCNPDKTVLIMSATQQKAIEFVSQTRKILNVVPYCKHMIPNEHTKDSALGFNHNVRTTFTQDMSCSARGSTSQITGLHSDLVICDDVEISTNTQTAEARESLLHKLSELESVRNKGSRVLFLGTPHSSESIYTVLKQAYPMVKYPAMMPDKTILGEAEDIADWVWELGVDAGESTQPERFDKDMLLERKAKIGPKAFALQYMLDTSLSDMDKYPLKVADLIVLDIDSTQAPEKIVWQGQNTNKKLPSWGMGGDVIMEPMFVSDKYTDYKHRHLVIDPSGRGADETAVCVASVSGGMIYIHELIGWDGGYSDVVLQKIAKVCLEYDINLVRIESNFGDGLFSKVITPVLLEYCGRIGIEEFRVTGAKEKRMLETLEPVMAQHRLVWDRKVAKDEKNQMQLTRLTEERGCLKHDDRVDALASAVDFYKDLLSQSTDKIVQQNRAKEWEETVSDWANNFRGGDYVPHSGAIRNISELKKKEKEKPMGLVVVTGLGPRTGTSYVMQQAKRAGLPVAGQKFVKGWTVPKHNPLGYWELDPNKTMDLKALHNKVVKLWNPTLQNFPVHLITRLIVLERKDKAKQKKSIAKVIKDEVKLKHAGQSLNTTDPDLILNQSIKGISRWLMKIEPTRIKHVYTEQLDTELSTIILFMKGGLPWV